ncbi:MAG: membrane protease YdiL (CAAX protease family) [Natronomonas sp.]|jgi:membrane protease YdiL (CAAX protease family)|uniref:CPBP family intramembrane glutamic endopeptidase n=1 Tax=Natronomonas sp. TaxID=2184060 RepID=UPI0039892910
MSGSASPATVRWSPIAAVAGAAGLGLVGFVVGVLVALIAVSLVGAVIPLSSTSPSANLLQLVGQGIGLVAVGYLYLESRGLPLSYVRIERPAFRDLGWVALATVVLFAVVAGSSGLANVLGLPLAEHGIADTIEANPSVALLFIPLSLLVTGPVEEFLYRGVIQTRLRETFGFAPAVAVSAIVFAAIHIPAYLSTTAPGTTLTTVVFAILPLAAVLGFVYEYTGNLVIPVLTHGIYNAAVFGVNYAEIVGIPGFGF